MTRGQVAGPAFAPVLRGVHVTAGTPQDHGLRAAAALTLLRGPAALGGLSAAWAYGVHEADDRRASTPAPAAPAPRDPSS